MKINSLEYWVGLEYVTSKEAACLICGHDPNRTNFNSIMQYSDTQGDVLKMFRMLENDIDSARLVTLVNEMGKRHICVKSLKKWMLNRGLTDNDFYKALPDVSPAKDVGIDIGAPHISESLRVLYLASDKFWKNADPNDKTTQFTNKDIIDFLIDQGLSKINAKQGATIIRPKWAAVGRKPKE